MKRLNKPHMIERNLTRREYFIVNMNRAIPMSRISDSEYKCDPRFYFLQLALQKEMLR